jgi:uncharacterized protein YndB with AHSA1/START domain
MREQVEPIRRGVSVRCDPERAFEVFTRQMATWWPVETHSRAAAELEDQGVTAQRVEVEERAGGRIIEHLSNGETLTWGEVVTWEPPGRLVLAWKPHGRPQPPTELEITFSPEDGGTRVELEHRGWERLTEDFTDLYESYGAGWVGTLDRYAAAAGRAAA